MKRCLLPVVLALILSPAGSIIVPQVEKPNPVEAAPGRDEITEPIVSPRRQAAKNNFDREVITLTTGDREFAFLDELPVEATAYEGLARFKIQTRELESAEVLRSSPAKSMSASTPGLFKRFARGRDAHSYSPAGLNSRVTQSEVDSLKAGLSQVLAGIENNLVDEVFEETLPLVGRSFAVAWSNNVAPFRYLNIVRTNVIAGLNTLTNAADYAPSSVASAINTRLTSAGFAAGSAVAVTTVNDEVQLTFTTSDTFT
ncbi:MAG TPA: hypothetical protein VK846_17140, partial [Candidatus Limnocylindria bacterium]|nr:hypothetical protein [Candidatus Limnocylindria bacterium]